MLVQGQSVSGFTSFYLPILIYQGSKNLKNLNIIVGILVKSDDTEGGLLSANATISTPIHIT